MTDRRTMLKYGLGALATLGAPAGVRAQQGALAPADRPLRIEPNPGDRDNYLRVGESDRFTLKFVKPR